MPFALLSQPGTWVSVYGGDQYDRGKGIAQTFDKGYIVCASSSSYGAGTTDFYLLKIDSAGKYQWQNTFGGLNIENAFCVKQTLDSGFVICGYTNSFGNGGYDAYLVKTDPQGNLQWERSYGTGDWDFTYWVEQTNDDGFILAGESYGFGNNTQAWLIKTDADGDTLWTRAFGSPETDDFKEVHQTIDHGFIAAGTTTGTSGDKDFYLVKTDSAGNTKWEKSYGGSGDDVCSSVSVCADGSYLLGGSANIGGVNKIYYLKTDSSGAVLVANVDTPSTGEKSVSRICESFDGQIVTLVNSNVGGFGGKEIFLVKWTSIWSLWVRTFGGTKDEEGYDLVQTADSGFALVGYTSTFGKGPDNIFMAKTRSDGGYLSTTHIFVGTNDLPEEKNNTVVYPNPCSGSIFLRFDNTFLNSKHELNFSVSDLSGKIIFSKDLIVPSSSGESYHLEVPSESFSSGVYIAAFNSGSKTFHKKIIFVK